MSIIALQTAFVTLALLSPELAFNTLDAEVAKIPEWEEERVVVGHDDDEEASRIICRFTINDREGPSVEPKMISTRKEGFADPEYLVADYADGTRVIELPEDDFALVRRMMNGKPAYAVLHHVNEQGWGFVDFA